MASRFAPRVALLWFGLMAAGPALGQTYVWREAETPDEADFAFQVDRGPQGDLLSGGAWLQANLSKEDVEAGKLDKPRNLAYRLEVPEAGAYRLWIRLGFEFARGPLSWQLDGGEWCLIRPTDLTTDLIELAVWCEAGWLDCGAQQLTQGTHTLSIRATKPEKADRFLMALDCFALVRGDWTPDANLRPGEKPDSEADRRAAAQMFAFADNQRTLTPGQRTRLSLDGLWEVCRDDDPNMDAAPYEPVRDIPPHPLWRGATVPGDIKDVPACSMAHRVWYRTRVAVPAELRGRSFVLDLTGTNWIASVVVNGQLVGSHRSTRVPWTLDITRAILPGETNELLIGVKDFYYAIDATFHKRPLNESRNIPCTGDFLRYCRWVAPIYPSSKGNGDGTVCGITDPIGLEVAGPVYTEDAFVKTSVGAKHVTAELTVRNPTQSTARVDVACEAVFRGSGQAEKTLPPTTVDVPAGGSKTVVVEADWADPKLWWPDEDPANLYDLRTTVRTAGEVADTHEQPFGFREVTIDGTGIRVNGLRRNFWNILGGLEGATPEDRIAHFRSQNNRFERFGSDLGLTRALGPMEEQLRWFDAHGIAGRLSTMIDGMFINFELDNPVVWENFREHCEQVAHAYRNHPSVMVYSLENELVLINGLLIHDAAGMDRLEAEARKMVDAAKAVDPTRPCMLDGAGALGDNSLEINCLHYPEPDGQFYPENAYTLERYARFGERWPWDRKRPLAMGETAFFSGKNSEWAWVGGDAAFAGREFAVKAGEKYIRSLLEGYRWAGVAMICPWAAGDRMPGTRTSMAPLAAFVREQSSSLLGGAPNVRTVKVFNDTFRREPVVFSWTLEMNGTRVGGEEKSLTIDPGSGQELQVTLAPPAVAERAEARWVVRVTRAGDEPFEDARTLSVLPSKPPVALSRAVYLLSGDAAFADRLTAAGVPTTVVASVAEAKPGGILLVGPDVLIPEQAAATDLLAYASAGGRVLCLEQDNPLQGAALPSPVKATDRQAYYVFPQGLGAPLLAGLGPDDLACWIAPGPTAKHVWEKPSGGIRSWAECGPELNSSALLEVPAGEGVMVASQLRIGANLGADASAGVLLANALRYCDRYKPATLPVSVYAPDRPAVADAIRQLGCRVRAVGSVREGLDASASPVLVVGASAQTLAALNADRAAAEAFTSAGGWIMLWGVEPDGLATLNALLGTEHVLRPFRLERVTLNPDPVTAGLGNRDVVMYSDREIMFGDKFLSPDVFTYVVDGADVAPFCRVPGQADAPYQPTYDDHDPFNWVNGMTNDESWRYIVQIWSKDWPAEGSPPFVFTLPYPVELERVRVWNNANYDTIERLEIQTDGSRAAEMTLPDAAALTEQPMDGRRAERTVGLVVRSYRDKSPMTLVGIDNVQFIRKLPTWYAGRVRPLVNCGGLVAYPRGKGGYILNQLKVTDSDLAPNQAKKSRIVSVILQNLGVAFGGG